MDNHLDILAASEPQHFWESPYGVTGSRNSYCLCRNSLSGGPSHGAHAGLLFCSGHCWSRRSRRKSQKRRKIRKKDAEEGDEKTDAENGDEYDSAEYNTDAVEGTQVDYSYKDDAATTRVVKPAPRIPLFVSTSAHLNR